MQLVQTMYLVFHDVYNSERWGIMPVQRFYQMRPCIFLKWEPALYIPFIWTNAETLSNDEVVENEISPRKTKKNAAIHWSINYRPTWILKRELIDYVTNKPISLDCASDLSRYKTLITWGWDQTRDFKFLDFHLRQSLLSDCL